MCLFGDFILRLIFPLYEDTVLVLICNLSDISMVQLPDIHIFNMADSERLSITGRMASVPLSAGFCA